MSRCEPRRSEVRLSKLLELIRATTPFADGDRQAAAGPRDAGPSGRGAASIAMPPQADRSWRELYDLLIKPVRDALPRAPGALLTIIPHGPLGALAFAGLQDERGRYLLEDYTLHYAPSAAPRCSSRPPAAGPTRASGRPADRLGSGAARPLQPRSATAAAAGRASREPRHRGADSTRAPHPLRRRRAAGDGRPRRQRPARSVLHFATHAIVRDDDPFSSFLALARSENDDGLLTAQEIYRLRLDADLVVLSACRSAGGRVTGDGIATFARAFIYAGAPSIVASLWDVADEPTNRLLPQFYRAWLGGASKARALARRATRLLTRAARRQGPESRRRPASSRCPSIPSSGPASR